MDLHPIGEQQLPPKAAKNHPPSSEVEQKLTTLAKEAFIENNFENKIKEIQILKKQAGIKNEKIKEILTRNGFKIEDIDKITRNTWNHGDPLKTEEAEQKLKNAPTKTWLLYFNENTNEYVISKKTKDGYKHLTDLKKIDVSIDNLAKGFSLKYRIKNMLLNKQVLEENLYNNGKMSEEEALNKLKDAPNGTWLFRHSENHNQPAFTMKININEFKHYYISDNDYEEIYNFSQLLDHINKNEPKGVKLQFSHNLGEINPTSQTKKQTEATITQIFIKEMSTRSLVRKQFETTGYAKISRAKYPELPFSCVIKNLKKRLKIIPRWLLLRTTILNFIKLFTEQMEF
jgi:SH2 domain